MKNALEAREHVINRGIFQRTTIAGIESDAFVLLVLFTGLCFVPVIISLRAMWMYGFLGLLVFGVGYAGLRIVYRLDPRFFVKFRSFMLWNTTFRARPALIACVASKRSRA
jgi:type IV secretory pathway TrbD component